MTCRHQRRILRTTTLLVLLAVLSAGCGGDSPSSTPPPAFKEIVLPDGMRISAPAGATYFYLHVPVTSASTLGLLPNLQDDGELVVGRIDWHFCNPHAAKLQFENAVGPTFSGAAWRIPTRVMTPLAGINILGIFAGGGTLEGGMRIDLDIDGNGLDPGSDRVRVLDGCAGDWVSLYGYTN
jgi:hypothetical protein